MKLELSIEEWRIVSEQLRKRALSDMVRARVLLNVGEPLRGQLLSINDKIATELKKEGH